MLPDGLRSLLLQTSAITAIIGTSAARAANPVPGASPGSGVYWALMPEKAPLPAIVLTQIAGAGLPTLNGPDPLHTARIQASCYATTYAQAKNLARAVRNLLEVYTGTLPDGTSVGNVILNLEADSFEEAPFLFHCPVDLEFWYSES